MGIEIEAKMRLTDLPGMEVRLNELGAKQRGDVLETNTFFDTADQRLKTSDRGLRIRVETTAAGAQEVTVTHKGPRAHGKLKTRAETEVRVDDAREAAELLTVLGYRPVLTFEKRRRRWTLDGCAVELDTLPHLGEYIEIEGPDEQAVLDVREKLGLAEAPLIKTSYIAMMVTHLSENQIETNMVRFEASASPG